MRRPALSLRAEHSDDESLNDRSKELSLGDHQRNDPFQQAILQVSKIGFFRKVLQIDFLQGYLDAFGLLGTESVFL